MRIFIIILVAVALFAIWFRSYYERKSIIGPACAITHRSIEKPMRLLFLTDLHGNSWGINRENFVKWMLDMKPDVILIGGDMIVAKPGKKKLDLKGLDELLSGLYGAAPIYYAEGNHEMRMRLETERYVGWWEEFNELLAAYDVKYLLDETVDLGGNVYLSGLEIEQELYGKFSKKKMPRGYLRQHLKDWPPEGAYHIIMAHTPKYMYDYARERPNLVLSGHYHGGIIVVPKLGPLISPEFRLFPKYAKGVMSNGDTHAIVSAGMGTHTINFRLNNRAEVNWVDLGPFDGNVG